MRNTKILKAKCKKTGRWSAMELIDVKGKWQVINMIPLTDAEAGLLSSEVHQPNLETNRVILPCSTCGNRKVSGCGCLQKRINCKKEMPYQYECIYCPEFQIDYSREKKSPYTKWAGISNIPDAIRDSYGNPLGSQYDLAEDYSFEGYKILIINPVYRTAGTATLNGVCKALERKGFEVTVETIIPSPRELRQWLAGKSQMWITSTAALTINEDHVNEIRRFFEAGHGIYVWGDNDPLNSISNFIIERLFGSRMWGDYFARQILSIQKKQGEPGIVSGHLISTGIENFFEGDSIAQIKLCNGLRPLIYSSDCNVVTAYYDLDEKRALIDGAFTRLWDRDWGQSAGTARYIMNAAAWLANVERFGSSEEASKYGNGRYSN